MARAFKAVALACARAASEKKGEDIALLHAGRESPLADYILIVTALSRPHLESLEDEVDRAARELHAPCLHRARPKSDQWRVLDFGGLIVHVMTQEARAFYCLERLHPAACRLRWSADGGRRKTPARAPAGRAKR